MLFVIGLIVLLTIMSFIGIEIGDRVSFWLIPVFSSIAIVLGGYSYIFVADTFFDVEDSLKVGEYTLWGFGILLVLMILSPNHTRTTKSGKADKRFKKQTDSDKVAISVFGFTTGPLVLGMLWAIDKYNLVAKTIAFFN